MTTNLLSNLVVDGAVQCANGEASPLCCLARALHADYAALTACDFPFFDTQKCRCNSVNPARHSLSSVMLPGCVICSRRPSTASRISRVVASSKQVQSLMTFAGRLLGPHSPVGVRMHWDKRAPCAPVLLVPDRSSQFDARALAYLWCPRRPRVARLLAFAALISPRIVL
jgi:hypothetical protein